MANPNHNNTSSSNPHHIPSPPPPPPPPAAAAAVELMVDNSSPSATGSFLTRREVLSRRSARVKRLARLYRAQYWFLMEELKRKHREYIWLYGKSPFLEDEKRNNESNCTNFMGGGTGEKVEVEPDRTEGFKKCAVAGCKGKAMAFTRFCHSHILSDSKQILYVACNYIIKSTQTGHVRCGKPVLRSTIPSYCSIHFQKAESFLARAVKRQGYNVSPSNKIAPKFYLLVKEFVGQIQMKRRAAKKAGVVKIESVEEETC